MKATRQATPEGPRSSPYEAAQKALAAPPPFGLRLREGLHQSVPRVVSDRREAGGISDKTNTRTPPVARLAKDKKLRQAKRKPRAYALTETKSR